jgi:NADH-quinone oxidoreductase subunit N
VLVLVLELAGRARRAPGVAFACVALAALAALGLAAEGVVAVPFPGHFSIDPGTASAKAVVLALALPVLLIARDEFDGVEFPALLLSSLYGIALMLSADSFLTLFLGLELMSLPVYVLVLLAHRRIASAEAALKYLVLGGVASAMLLMGASLIFGSSGSLARDAFTAALGSADAMVRVGVVLVLLALFLKSAIVPFHGWAPDAYEGASVPVTAYMAVLVKAGVMLAALRLVGNAKLASPLVEIVALLPLASIVWGNLAAMRQASLRRMIAYSSIAHAGYLFYALLGDPATRLQAVVFYVAAYGLLNLLAFAALPAMASDTERDRLDNLQGLFRREPFAALMIGVAMLSLAGIPPLPGFAAKFLIFRNVMAAGYTAYAVSGLVASYLGIYFYLRVIQLMFMNPDARVERTPPLRAATVASFACLAGTLLLAVFPGWLIARL